ncbi:MAG: hypothetical protein ABIP65_04800 [Vicinamibacterales bacterium]
MIISAFTRLIFAAYFIEAGLILVVVPWSGFWDRNALASILPASRAWIANPFIRGAVTGVGVITTAAGLMELVSAFGLFRRGRAGAAPTPPPS